MNLPLLKNSKTKQGATIIALVLAVMQVLEVQEVIPFGTGEALMVLAPGLIKIFGGLWASFGVRDAIAKAGI